MPLDVYNKVNMVQGQQDSPLSTISHSQNLGGFSFRFSVLVIEEIYNMSKLFIQLSMADITLVPYGKQFEVIFG